MNGFTFQPVAYVRNDFPTKFGIPRQSNLVEELISYIEFVPGFSNISAVEDLKGFNYIWLIWVFDDFYGKEWSPTIRPPRMGGNKRYGVFSTRAPHRPNPIAISSVKLIDIIDDGHGHVKLKISGADMKSGTPVLDIKPYIKYADSHPEATDGYLNEIAVRDLTVECDKALLSKIPKEKNSALISILKHDPRPRYQNDPDRLYGFVFAGFEIKFKVADFHLTVVSIEPAAT